MPVIPLNMVLLVSLQLDEVILLKQQLDAVRVHVILLLLISQLLLWHHLALGSCMLLGTGSLWGGWYTVRQIDFTDFVDWLTRQLFFDGRKTLDASCCRALPTLLLYLLPLGSDIKNASKATLVCLPIFKLPERIRKGYIWELTSLVDTLQDLLHSFRFGFGKLSRQDIFKVV